VLLRRGDVAPPASQDGHSRCRVAELRARSHSDAWGTQLSSEPRERKTSDGLDYSRESERGEGGNHLNGIIARERLGMLQPRALLKK